MYQSRGSLKVTLNWHGSGAPKSDVEWIAGARDPDENNPTIDNYGHRAGSTFKNAELEWHGSVLEVPKSLEEWIEGIKHSQIPRVSITILD